jgi:osmoprotectant transport system permease protein
MAAPMTAAAGWRPRLDKLGVLVAGLALAGAALPFATYRANRIVLGEPRSIVDSLGISDAVLLYAVLAAAALIALLRGPGALKLAASGAGLVALAVAAGRAGTLLMGAAGGLARVSPAGGFWVLVFAFALLAADALTRLRPTPLHRLAGLALAGGLIAGFLMAGVWDDLSILKEYSVRRDAFWREAGTHVLLAFGSLVLATAAGVPMGIACYRKPRLRAPTLNVLNIIQTIPSIALFGLLVAPLAWVAAHVPGAAAVGVAGIGVAPALIALFGYALLPVVSNTLVGLDGVPRQARDAAFGMGMTHAQKLVRVELPLAFPVILTGIRIVLVQNIGIATIAALIGGGGFGVFVFQGIGQTAMDLVLLGAVPTVALTFVAAIVLDGVIEMSGRPGAGRRGP